MIEAYLTRLGLEHPPVADLASLRGLQASHQRAIPFENIDVWSGVPLDLDPDALAEKILSRRRGGFCYELNFLFSRLLTELGYPVRLMSAGVFNAEGVVGPPFDHLCLRVETSEGPWLCDVGFGRAPMHPIPLVAAEHIGDGAGAFRLRSADEARDGFGPPHWAIARESVEGWMPLYLFDLVPRRIEDFAAQCAWHQNSPDAMFPKRLIVTHATADGRVSVRDLEWTRERDGVRERGHFASAEERRAMIREEFGLELP